MTNIFSIISIAEVTPNTHEFDLWHKAESLYNDKNNTASKTTNYARQIDYHNAKINWGGGAIV